MAVKNENEKKTDDKLYCSSCGKEKASRFFYKSKNPKDLTGYCTTACKQCIKDKIYIRNGDIDKDAFKKTLYELDLPFFNDLYLASIESDKETVGNYLARLNTYTGGYGRGNNISWEQGEGFEDIKKPKENLANIIKDEEQKYNESWRGTYSQSDLNYLNDYLEKLKIDYKIITNNHLDYGKKIAKASLAVDKAYDDMLSGRKESDKRYKDLQAIFDTLSKSAQFSENTRSGADAGISGISQIVDKIESKQWIYEREIFEKDDIDHLLNQFSNINKSL